MSDNHTIRLVNKGWQRFTGTMGAVEFVDGVSTRACTQREVDHLAAITRIETVSGEAAGIAHRLKGGATVPAEVKPPLARQTEKAKDAENATPAGEAKPVIEKRYTVEELHAVADAKGLAGLREIATPRKLKGRSINDLVEAIVKDQEDRLGKLPEAPVEASAPDASAPEDDTPTIDGDHDANAQAAAALSQSQDV